MDTVRQGVREELCKFDAADPAWNLYLFLTLSDQARKLTRHFENIDLHRLEFQAPFFDPNLLQAVLASRLDWFLRHKFYHQLLPHFGAAAARVPWQSYPGHEPCPLPIPREPHLSMEPTTLGERTFSETAKTSSPERCDCCASLIFRITFWIDENSGSRPGFIQPAGGITNTRLKPPRLIHGIPQFVTASSACRFRDHATFLFTSLMFTIFSHAQSDFQSGTDNHRSCLGREPELLGREPSSGGYRASSIPSMTLTDSGIGPEPNGYRRVHRVIPPRLRGG